MRLVWCRQGLTALPKSILLCGVLIRCDDHSHGEYDTKQCQRTSKCHHLDDWGKGCSSEGLVDTVGWRAQLYETARRPGKDLGTSAPTRVGLGWAGLGWAGLGRRSPSRRGAAERKVSNGISLHACVAPFPLRTPIKSRLINRAQLTLGHLG